MSCKIDCWEINNFPSTGCDIEPNAIVVVPSDNYNAYEICYKASEFRREDYNIMVDCDVNDIPVDTFCRDMEAIEYNITISLSALSTSPKELVVICGYS